MAQIGFLQSNEGGYKEFLPYSEQLQSDTQKRLLFFHMLNAYLDEPAIRFTKKESLSCAGIKTCIHNKIMKMLDISCIRTYTPYKGHITIDAASTLLIYAYFLGKKIPFPFRKRPKLPAGKLIDLIYKPQGLSLMLDIDDMFLHLVYERVKLVNRPESVQLYEKHIVICNGKGESTMLIPAYTKIDPRYLNYDPIVEAHVHTAAQTLKQSTIRNIFLVYPKHTGFTKYMHVRITEDIPLQSDEYRVKEIPYSFSFCTQRQNKNTHTRRQKCRK